MLFVFVFVLFVFGVCLLGFWFCLPLFRLHPGLDSGLRNGPCSLLTPQSGMLRYAMDNSFTGTNTVLRPDESREGVGRKKKQPETCCVGPADGCTRLVWQSFSTSKAAGEITKNGCGRTGEETAAGGAHHWHSRSSLRSNQCSKALIQL